MGGLYHRRRLRRLCEPRDVRACRAKKGYNTRPRRACVLRCPKPRMHRVRHGLRRSSAAWVSGAPTACWTQRPRPGRCLGYRSCRRMPPTQSMHRHTSPRYARIFVWDESGMSVRRRAPFPSGARRPPPSLRACARAACGVRCSVPARWAHAPSKRHDRMRICTRPSEARTQLHERFTYTTRRGSSLRHTPTASTRCARTPASSSCT